MKITAVFLGNNKLSLKNVESYISKILNSSFKLVYITFSVIALTFFVSYIKISPKVFYLATNFRQAEAVDLELLDFMNIYSIYNKDNYIIAEVEKDTDLEIKEEEKNIEFMSEFEIIDSVAEDKTEEAVFENMDILVNVTSENKTLQRIDVGTMKVLNYSDKREINFSEILNSSLTFTKLSDKILLYNTHTSESYSNSEKYQFDYTGTSRTTDANYNMIAIAKAFSDNLNSKGFVVIQDTTPHDYGTYTSSYSRSRITVESALQKMGGASISVDVHRDAIADLSYRPIVNIKGVQVAQLMFVMGVGSDTTENPYYEDNLKLALKLQLLADKVYPGLFRPMIIRNSVYNQDLNKYSLLVEVGATGNTIEEAKLATRCLTNLLNIVYKD